MGAATVATALALVWTWDETLEGWGASILGLELWVHQHEADFFYKGSPAGYWWDIDDAYVESKHAPSLEAAQLACEAQTRTMIAAACAAMGMLVP